MGFSITCKCQVCGKTYKGINPKDNSTSFDAYARETFEIVKLTHKKVSPQCTGDGYTDSVVISFGDEETIN